MHSKKSKQQLLNPYKREKILKINFLLFLLLIFTLNTSLLAQEELPPVTNQQRFNKLLKDSKDWKPVSITETKDGFVILSNITAKEVPSTHMGLAYNFKLAKYNKDGIFEWSKFYANEKIGLAKEIFTTKNGDYIIAQDIITSNLTSNGRLEMNDFDVHVDKLDKSGKTIWNVDLGQPKIDWLRNMIPSTKNTYLILHTTNFKGAYGINVLLSKINSKGDLLWTKTVAGARDIKHPNIASNKDGLCYLSYTVYDKCFILLINQKGRTLWKKEFTEPRENTRYIITSMTELNNDIIVSGYTIENSSTDDFYGFIDFWICKLDKNGKNIWNKVIGGNKEDKVFVSTINDKQEIIVAGTSKSSQSRDFRFENLDWTDIWVLKLDPQGSIIWERQFGGDGYENISKILPTSQNTYILLGSSDSENPNFTNKKYDGETYTYVIEFDEDGNTHSPNN